MAEILKVSTPLIDRNQTSQQAARQTVDTAVPFDLSDVSKVIATTDPTEILQQNTGFVPGEEAPKVLADLLKDPSVTVGMIRNIYLLQEVFKLLPANNTTLTQEIQDLFNKLLVSPDEIVPELLRQEQNTTIFKGDLFDTLRNLLMNPEKALAGKEGAVLEQALTQGAEGGAGQAQSALENALFQGGNVLQNSLLQQGGKSDLPTSIGVLLKAINAALGKDEALKSVANNLSYLADSLSASSRLSDKLTDLVQQLRAPNAGAHFGDLKTEVLEVLKDVQNSVLFTPQMEKTLPLVIYNLSKYNTNDDFLPDALRFLLANIDGPGQKKEIVQQLEAYLNQYQAFGGSQAVRAAEDESHVMDIIAKIIGKQAKSEDLHLLSGDNIEKIVHSLLSSPSNFTPLLHFIIPVEYMDMKAFAEMWIDPNAEDENTPNRPGDVSTTSHVLVVFDVEGIGRFETELFVENKRIAMNLLCPPAYVDNFRDIAKPIRQAVSATGYSFEAINIDRLERTHSLMEVFTDLPHKRMGIDVKI